MATVLTNDANYTAIANAIRAKGGEGTFTPAQMATAIANLPSGGANKVLTSAIITGTSSKIDISNYVEDDNFILFFGYSTDKNRYYRTMYAPTIPWSYYGTTGCASILLAKASSSFGYSFITSNGFLNFYSSSSSADDAFSVKEGTSWLSYSNGIFTITGTSCLFATSSLLIYLAEATT